MSHVSSDIYQGYDSTIEAYEATIVLKRGMASRLYNITGIQTLSISDRIILYETRNPFFQKFHFWVERIIADKAEDCT